MNEQMCLGCGSTCDPICMTCPTCGSYSLVEVEDCPHSNTVEITEDGMTMCLECGRTWDYLGSGDYE